MKDPHALATLCESVATWLSSGRPALAVPPQKYLGEVATAVRDLPMTHPMRWTDVRDEDSRLTDRVLRMADDIQRDKATPEDLRAFAAELRAGAAEMVTRGWWPTMHGSAQ